jgi:hypothetical protein
MSARLFLKASRRFAKPLGVELQAVFSVFNVKHIYTI